MSGKQNKGTSALQGGGSSKNMWPTSSGGLLVSGLGAGGMGPSVTLVSYKAPDRTAAMQPGGPASATAAAPAKPKSPYLVRPAHHNQSQEGGSMNPTGPARSHERPSTAPIQHHAR